ncbi:MAG: ABC transporter substrate-binding protein, partial [Acidimicrobiia bacterium]|nr:ABC transporter substrate-binding protein [Acidimicrobiia bacterium]
MTATAAGGARKAESACSRPRWLGRASQLTRQMRSSIEVKGRSTKSTIGVAAASSPSIPARYRSLRSAPATRWCTTVRCTDRGSAEEPMRLSQATPMVEIPESRTGRRRRVIVAIVAVAAVMAALAAGCSSGGSSKSSTIRIGLEGPLSGSQSDTGTAMLRGAQMAAEELNAKGGIGGRKVEIVPIDDKADPEAGTAAATAAVAAGLEGVVGPYNSGVGLRTLPIYIAAGLVPLRFTSADTTAGLGFTLQPMTSQIAPVATDAIVKWAKATSVALIVDSTQTYNKDAAAAMAKTLPAAGARITTTVEITPGGTTYA